MSEVLEAVQVEKANEKTPEQIQAEQNLDFAIPDIEFEQGAQGAQGAQSEPIADATESLYGMLSLIPIGCKFTGYSNIAAVWNESACRGVSSACIPVFRKYAWGAKIINFLETGAGVEELALGAVLLPIGLATYGAYQLDTKPIETEVKQAEKANEPTTNYPPFDLNLNDAAVWGSNRQEF